MDKTIKKSYRILLLALIFFLSGLAFFLSRTDWFKGEVLGRPKKVEMSSRGFGNPSGNITSESPLVFTNFPDPKIFQKFTVPIKNDILEVSGQCSDSYYTILIFAADTDYRKVTPQAKFNRAFLCPSGGHFTQQIDLKDLNLADGGYYVVRAQQGRQGSWYEPY